jgi:hypothetical protein
MVSNGFKITKIHGVLRFNQKPYLKTFIDTFVDKRCRTNSKVEMEMYKLILNSAFGKMCEGVRNRSRCDVVTDPQECARIIADPNFTSFTSIETSMVLLHRKKRNVVLNKNIAGGSSVLEISKKLMLSFFYNVCKVHWQGEGEVQVYYGDTDSLLLKVNTGDLLNDLENGEHIRSQMDFTNWNASLYLELMKHQASDQLFMLKSETGSDLYLMRCFPVLKFIA